MDYALACFSVTFMSLKYYFLTDESAIENECDEDSKCLFWVTVYIFNPTSKCMIASSLVPFFEGRRRKDLVYIDCTCAHLYPESGYIVYCHKILSKLQ